MNARRFLTRTGAVATAATLLAGPLAAGAEAAPKKKTPTPTITVRPPAVTRSQSATFEFTDTAAGAAFTCALDGAAYTACTSPKSYEGVAPGAHVFRVRATATGMVVSNAASASWTIDHTPPPVPTLSGAPAAQTKEQTASITLSNTEAVTYACSVDGGAYAGCTSPVQLSGLLDGAHSLAVTATDAVGNVSAPATAAWTVDTQPPPAPSITTGPAARTNATSATFAVHDTDASATLACALDGGTPAPCGPTATYESLAEGVHTLDVTATDAVGNASSAPRFTWTVDLTAPTPPTILSGPTAVTKDAAATFTFELPADAVQLRCAVDSTTEYADCATTFQTAPLGDGPHSLLVLAKDEATNESSPTPYSWTVDATPPPAPSVTGPAALTTATGATFGITDTESPLSFTCALDGGEAVACADGFTLAGPLANGPHTLVVTAADAAGNTATAQHAWVVDAAAPTVTLNAPATLTAPVTATFGEDVKGVTASSLALRVEGSAANLPATVTCATTGGTAVSCADGPVRTAVLKPAARLMPGQRYVVVANPSGAASITDLAGNPLAATTAPFRALTTVQENAAGASFAWQSWSSASAYGGAYRRERLAGAAVTYGFTGTSITWYTITSPGQGKADVYVDGVRLATINNYSSRTTYKVPRTISGLAAARHQIKIVVLGVKGSAAGTGTYVSVDAMKAGTLVTNPTLGNKWRNAAAVGPSGGYLAQADLSGASTSLTFRGTAVSFWTSTGKNRGIAKLYVDGVLKGTYDLYSATTAYNVRRTVLGLSDAVHTVKVVVTGTKRAAATGTMVCLDRWVVA